MTDTPSSDPADLGRDLHHEANFFPAIVKFLTEGVAAASTSPDAERRSVSISTFFDQLAYCIGQCVGASATCPEIVAKMLAEQLVTGAKSSTKKPTINQP
jgi:hypothetical protein